MHNNKKHNRLFGLLTFGGVDEFNLFKKKYN